MWHRDIKPVFESLLSLIALSLSWRLVLELRAISTNDTTWESKTHRLCALNDAGLDWDFPRAPLWEKAIMHKQAPMSSHFRHGLHKSVHMVDGVSRARVVMHEH